MMTTDTAHPPNSCANCGHRLAVWDKFCSQCGQDTANHPPSLWEFVHEFLLHYVAFEGRLWKSLWGLLAKPGYLTAEYLAGRKQRYVLPLRLILTLGLAFFLTLKLSGVASLEGMVEADRQASRSAAAAQAAGVPASAIKASPAASSPESDEDDATVIGLPEAWSRQLPEGIQARIKATNERARKDWRAELGRIGQTMLGLAPYAVLCSLPFYAGLLALVYWRRRMPYGLHFVFAMHLHAAWYGVLLLALLPWGAVQGLAWLWGNAYPVLAMRRVYGGSWWRTLGRAALLAMLHWVVLLLGLLTLLLFGALSG